MSAKDKMNGGKPIRYRHDVEISLFVRDKIYGLLGTNCMEMILSVREKIYGELVRQ